MAEVASPGVRMREKVRSRIERKIIEPPMSKDYAERQWRPEQSVIDIIQNHLDATQIRGEKLFLKLAGIEEKYDPANGRQQKIFFLMDRLHLYPEDREITENAYDQLAKIVPGISPLEQLQEQLKDIPQRPTIMLKISNGEETKYVAYEAIGEFDSSWHIEGFRVQDDGAGFEPDLLAGPGLTMKKGHPRTRGGIGEGLKVSVNRLVADDVNVSIVSSTPDGIWEAKPFHEDGKLKFSVQTSTDTLHTHKGKKSGSLTEVDFTNALSESVDSGHTRKAKLTTMINALDPRIGEGLGKYFVEFSDRVFTPIQKTVDLTVMSDQDAADDHKGIPSLDFRVSQRPSEISRVYVRGVYISERGDTLFDYDLPKWGFTGADRKGVKLSVFREGVRQLIGATTDTQVIQTMVHAMRENTGTLEMNLLWRASLQFTAVQKDLWRQITEETNEFVLGKTIYASMGTKLEDIRTAETNGYKVIMMYKSEHVDFLRSLYKPDDVVVISQLIHNEEVTPPEANVATNVMKLIAPVRIEMMRFLADNPTLLDGLTPNGLEAMSSLPAYQEDETNGSPHNSLPLYYLDKDKRLYVKPEYVERVLLDFPLETATWIALTNVLLESPTFNVPTQNVLTRLLGNGLREANTKLGQLELPNVHIDESGMFVIDFSSREEAHQVQELIAVGQQIERAQRPRSSLEEIQQALTAIRVHMDNQTVYSGQGLKKTLFVNNTLDELEGNRPFKINTTIHTPNNPHYGEARIKLDPYYLVDGTVYKLSDDLTLEPVEATTLSSSQYVSPQVDETPTPDYARFLESLHMALATDKQQPDPFSIIIDPRRTKPLNTTPESPYTNVLSDVLDMYGFLLKSPDKLSTRERAYLSILDFSFFDEYLYPDEATPKVLSLPRDRQRAHFQIDKLTPQAFIPLELEPGEQILLQLTTPSNPSRVVQIEVRRKGDQFTATRVAPDEPAATISRGEKVSTELGNLSCALFGSALKLEGGINYSITAIRGGKIQKPEKLETNRGKKEITVELEIDYRQHVWKDELRNLLDGWANHQDADRLQKPQLTYTVVNTATGEILHNISEKILQALHLPNGQPGTWEIVEFMLKDKGGGFPTEYITILGDSSKSEDEVGKNGEGLKLIMISAVRAGIHAEIASRDWTAKPSFYTKPIKDHEREIHEEFRLLRYDMTWTPDGRYREGSYTRFSLLPKDVLQNGNRLSQEQLNLLNQQLQGTSEQITNWKAWTQIVDARMGDDNEHYGMHRFVLDPKEIGDTTVTVLPERSGKIFEKGITIPEVERGDHFLFGYNIDETIINTRERNTYDGDRLDKALRTYYRNLTDIEVMKAILQHAKEHPQDTTDYYEYQILADLAPIIEFGAKGLWEQAFYEVFGNNAILSLSPIQHRQYAPRIRSKKLDIADVVDIDIEDHRMLNKTRDFSHHISPEIEGAIAMERHLVGRNLVLLPPSLAQFCYDLDVYSSRNYTLEVNVRDIPTSPETNQFLADTTHQVAETMADVLEFLLDNPDPIIGNYIRSITPEEKLREKIRQARNGIPLENVHIKATSWPWLGGVSLLSNTLELKINASLLKRGKTDEENDNISKALVDTIAHELVHLFFGQKDYTKGFQEALVAMAIGGKRLGKMIVN